jgi:hypothetical protein
MNDESAIEHRDDAVPLAGDGVVRDKTHGFSLPPKLTPDSGEPCDHVCPECKTGKHRNCDGTSWCFRDDVPAECSCLTCEWGRAS